METAYNHYLFDALTKESFISFDPNYRADLWKDDEATFIKKCLPYVEKSHLCKFSLEEALLLSGKDTVEEACPVLHEIGVQIIAVTLGKDGTYLSMNGNTAIVPSVSVSPVDTTGAGDAFIGCLLYQIAGLQDFNSIFSDTEGLKKMIAIANKAGAITTTQYGAINALPNLTQLEE